MFLEYLHSFTDNFVRVSYFAHAILQSFEDLHKLWFVLYKERNLLLTTKQKLKRTQRPVIASEEHRYDKVKRSMGAIKHVLNERRKIDKILGVSSSIPANYNKTGDASK